MTVGDKNVAIGRGEDVGGRIECVGTGAGRHRACRNPQDLPVRRKFHDSLVLSVGDPDGAVRSGEQAVRPAEQSGPEAHDEPACCVEFLDRRDVGAVAALAAAAVEYPYARTVAIDVNADRHPPYPPLRQLRPVVDDVIWIGGAVGIVGLAPVAGCCNAPRNRCSKKTRVQNNSCAFAHLDSSRLWPAPFGVGALCIRRHGGERALFCRLSQDTVEGIKEHIRVMVPEREVLFAYPQGRMRVIDTCRRVSCPCPGALIDYLHQLEGDSRGE